MNGSCNNTDGAAVPEDIICFTDLVTEIFGSSIDPDRTSELAECAISALKTIIDDTIDHVYVEKSQDEPIDEAIYLEGQNDHLFQQEYIDSLNLTGMPPHELRPKKGTIVMLLRNLDVTNGLCNGTRLKVEKLGRFTLGCSFICGDKRREFAIIPRIDNYWESRVPFRLRRRQFPVRIAFAMTINNAQGQSFNKVGVYLPQDVFSHGQLYVAQSRARSRSGVKLNRQKQHLQLDRVLSMHSKCVEMIRRIARCEDVLPCPRQVVSIGREGAIRFICLVVYGTTTVRILCKLFSEEPSPVVASSAPFELIGQPLSERDRS
ncbi:hypothetical protein OSTOST_11355 [Ostertagia ostertagi]